jgi:peptide/nickel transport system substrate-binding protein
MSRRINRRDFLRLSSLTIAGGLLAACSPQSTPTTAPAVEATKPAAAPTAVPTAVPAATSKYKDSPYLAGKNLPPVAERIPADPLVYTHKLILPEGYIKDVAIGSYGGPYVFTTDEGAIMSEVLFYSVNRTPIPTGSAIFASLEHNTDYTAYTFKIRKGLKWSDGVPVTTEDVRFALEDATMNPDLYAVLTNWLRTGGTGTGTPAKLTVVDDFTFTLTFDALFPTFITYISGNWTWYSTLIKPKHYLSKFHQKYAKADELDAAVKTAGLSKWTELFLLKDAGWPDQESAIGEPRLDPWIPTEWKEDRHTMVRNPYYSLVDSAGNQLPYMDEIIVYPVSFSAPETAELMMYSGQGHYNWNLDDTKLPQYKSEEAKGKIVVLPYPNKDSRMMTLNLTYGPPDGEWRKVVGDVRFRQAVLLGMNKEEINKELYLNTAHMNTISIKEYDPAKANQLLDDMGMTKKDADGYRMYPSGAPFEIILTLMPEVGYSYQAPFIAGYMKNIGIKLTYKQVEGSVYWNIVNAGEHMGTIIWNFAPAYESNVADPGFMPGNDWAPLWRLWNDTGGKKGEVPPDWIKESYQIFADMSKFAYGSAEYKALEKKRDKWVYDNVPYMTFVEQPGIVHIFSSCLGNIGGTEGTKGMPFHHGSWTHHRLIYFKPGCKTT